MYLPIVGVRLRLRSPAFPAGDRIRNVTVGGKAWPNFNDTAETVDFGAGAAVLPSAAAMQRIVVNCA